MKSRKIIVALDSNNLNKTIRLVKNLKRDVYAFKIGYQFFYNFGLEGYKKVYSICPNIFLDLKLHDIPNTVEKGLAALVKMKPLFTTIHISGGDDMMRVSKSIKKNTKILGVSILTSLDSDQTKKYYNKKNVSALVKQFSRAAKKNKLDGVVCSPKEIKYIRKEIGRSFIIITPGIRINNKLRSDDQKRVETPKRALDQGANYLVIGRPITMSKDPLKTLREINNSLI